MVDIIADDAAHLEVAVCVYVINGGTERTVRVKPELTVARIHGREYGVRAWKAELLHQDGAPPTFRNGVRTDTGMDVPADQPLRRGDRRCYNISFDASLPARDGSFSVEVRGITVGGEAISPPAVAIVRFGSELVLCYYMVSCVTPRF